jgi:hypothetical protein
VYEREEEMGGDDVESDESSWFFNPNKEGECEGICSRILDIVARYTDNMDGAVATF